MSDKIILAVDLGASSGRVIAGAFDGRRITLNEVHRFPNGPVTLAGTKRWNVLSLWSEIQNGLSVSAREYGDRILSIGVDTWGVDYVLLSAKDELLGQPYNHRDSRTDGIMEHAFTRVPRQQIFAATGLQFMPINTLYQLIAMQLRDPELLSLADKFLMMPDFFHWLLCGSKVVEFTNATTTQFFAPQQKTWATDLLRKFDLPTGMLPEIVYPGTKLGQLRKDVSHTTGLARIDVVAPATHDTGSAVAAVPTKLTGSSNWAYISSGTWSLIGVEIPQAILTEEALQWNVTNEGGIDGTYRLLKNVMGLWLIQEIKRSLDQRGRTHDFAELVQLARKAEPFRSLINPDEPVFLNPSDMIVAIQETCRLRNEPIPETPGQLVRCALESLALRYREVLRGIEKLTGEKVGVIHIVGGGCQNELLNQFTAEACGVPVIAGPTEATAMGNILVQARAAGEVGTLAEIREIVTASSHLEKFEPHQTAVWDEAFHRYRRS